MRSLKARRFLMMPIPSVTLSAEGSVIEFVVSGGVIDGDDVVVNEPMR